MFENDKKAELTYIVKNVPVLYKYTQFKSFEPIVVNHSLMFRNPTLFNDPFDCYPGLMNFENIPKNYRKNLIEKYRPLLSSDQIKRVENSSDQEVARVFHDIAFPSELSKIAVTCFSEKYDNLLMWSHYANSHTGICIGFNLQELLLAMRLFRPALMKVKYTNKFVPTDYFTHPKEAISNWYRIKSDSWSYEKEIRIVLTNINMDSSKQVFIPISTASFSTIYLGAKIDSNDESKVRSICSQHLPEVKIYKMHLKKDSFSLSHE